jgi:hypothetical protein
MAPKDVSIAFWRGASPQTWAEMFGAALVDGCYITRGADRPLRIDWRLDAGDRELRNLCVAPEFLREWCGDEGMAAFIADSLVSEAPLVAPHNIRRAFVRQCARWFWPHRGRETWTPQQIVEGECLGWGPYQPSDVWPSESLKISGELAGMDWEGGVRVKDYGPTPDKHEWLLIWIKGGQNGYRSGWVRKDTFRQWAGQYGDDAIRCIESGDTAWDGTVWRLARLLSERSIPASPGLGVERVDVYAVDPVRFGVVRDGQWYAVDPAHLV